MFVSHLESKNWIRGIVSYNSNSYCDYDIPRIHNTYRKKWGGWMHIDMGYPGIHLMLDRHGAPYFIEFIKNLRTLQALGIK